MSSRCRRLSPASRPWLCRPRWRRLYQGVKQLCHKKAILFGCATVSCHRTTVLSSWNYGTHWRSPFWNKKYRYFRLIYDIFWVFVSFYSVLSRIFSTTTMVFWTTPAERRRIKRNSVMAASGQQVATNGEKGGSSRCMYCILFIILCHKFSFPFLSFYYCVFYKLGSTIVNVHFAISSLHKLRFLR